jgi:CRISPR/Cas system-associated endonuclease Cas1
LLDSHGRFKARLEGAVSGNVLLRQAQHRPGRDPAFALAVARNCVAGKVRNCRQVLLRGSREAKAPEEAAILTRGAADLAATLRALPGAGDARYRCAASRAKRRASISRRSTAWCAPVRARVSGWTAAPGARRGTGSMRCCPLSTRC